jgi:hypothetical protein
MLITVKTHLAGSIIYIDTFCKQKRRFIFAEVYDSYALLNVYKSVQSAQALFSDVEDDRQWAEQLSNVLCHVMKTSGGGGWLLLAIADDNLTTVHSAGAFRAHHINRKKKQIVNSNHMHKILSFHDRDPPQGDSDDPVEPMPVTEQWRLVPDQSLIFVCSSYFFHSQKPEHYIRQIIEFDMDSVIGFRHMLCFKMQLHDLSED